MEAYGVEVMEQMSIKEEVPLMVEEFDAKASCKWVLTRGRRFGQTCDKKCLIDTEYCKDHEKGQSPLKDEVVSVKMVDVPHKQHDVTQEYNDEELNDLSVEELQLLLISLEKESKQQEDSIQPLPIPEESDEEPKKDLDVASCSTHEEPPEPEPAPEYETIIEHEPVPVVKVEEPIVVVVQVGTRKVTITIE